MEKLLDAKAFIRLAIRELNLILEPTGDEYHDQLMCSQTKEAVRRLSISLDQVNYLITLQEEHENGR